MHLFVDVLGAQVNHGCEQAVVSLTNPSFVFIFALKGSCTIDRLLEPETLIAESALRSRANALQTIPVSRTACGTFQNPQSA